MLLFIIAVVRSPLQVPNFPFDKCSRLFIDVKILFLYSFFQLSLMAGHICRRAKNILNTLTGHSKFNGDIENSKNVINLFKKRLSL